jgi:hypothetical protein
MNSTKEMTAHPHLPLGKESSSTVSTANHQDTSQNPKESSDGHQA